MGRVCVWNVSAHSLSHCGRRGWRLFLLLHLLLFLFCRSLLMLTTPTFAFLFKLPPSTPTFIKSSSVDHDAHDRAAYSPLLSLLNLCLDTTHSLSARPIYTLASISTNNTRKIGQTNLAKEDQRPRWATKLLADRHAHGTAEASPDADAVGEQARGWRNNTAVHKAAIESGQQKVARRHH
jgi:hypothetical protein